MSGDQLSPQEQKELEQLADYIAGQLASGKTQYQVVQELVNNGWEQADASQFVSTIGGHVDNARRQHARSEGGGGMGCLVWIGILVLINVLSYLFDWPFWIY